MFHQKTISNHIRYGLRICLKARISTYQVSTEYKTLGIFAPEL
jgi:hypothetical protein